MNSKEEKMQRAMQQKEAARGKSTSIRFSDNDRKIINEKAEEKNMCFSEYVRDSAVHGGESLSPYAKTKIQNLINEAYDVLKGSNPEKAAKMEKEMNDVWTR